MTNVFFVEPKSNCPHISDNLKLSPEDVKKSYLGDRKCIECKNENENWIDLTDGSIRCGRFVEKHMLLHYEKLKHSLALSISDLSFWCFDCDSYITSPVLKDHFAAIHEAKFGEAPPAILNKEEAKETKKEEKSEKEDVNKEVKEETKEKSEKTDIKDDDILIETKEKEKIEIKETGEEEKIQNSEEIQEEEDSDLLVSTKDMEEIEGIEIDQLQRLLAMLGLRPKLVPPPPPREQRTLLEPTIQCVVEAIKSGKCKNIVVMSGAGISVAAGIPDFRSPKTGLYANLQKYNLPHPEAIFEIGFFKENPQPFYTLAKELYPGLYKATPCHLFIKLLEQKGILLRNYTQNIDTLERIANVSSDLIVEAHGSFAEAHCVDCSKSYDTQKLKEEVFSNTIPRCAHCSGLVKPDIVFFGESLPGRFFQLAEVDFVKCDLLLVLGTSLKVHPFAGLVNHVNSPCPRVLINRETVFEGPDGFLFNHEHNYRDVAFLGDVQEQIKLLVSMLGWDKEFTQLLENENKK